MPPQWTFGAPEEDTDEYKDGTVVPARRWTVYRDNVPVGEIECHLHRRAGPDKAADFSAGITVVVYSSPGDEW